MAQFVTMARHYGIEVHVQSGLHIGNAPLKQVVLLGFAEAEHHIATLKSALADARRLLAELNEARLADIAERAAENEGPL